MAPGLRCRTGLGTWLGRGRRTSTCGSGGRGRLVDDDGDRASPAGRPSSIAGERLAFTWWPGSDDGRRPSDVVFAIEETDAGSRLVITETRPTALTADGALGGVLGHAGAVALALRLLAGQGLTDPLDPLFDALADPTRRRLLQRLVQDGPDTASHLAVDLPVTRQAVVKHLQALVEAGLAASRSAAGARCATGPSPSRWPKP